MKLYKSGRQMLINPRPVKPLMKAAAKNEDNTMIIKCVSIWAQTPGVRRV